MIKLLTLLLSIIFSILLIIIGLYILIKYNKYQSVNAIVKKASCLLDRQKNDFTYLCQLTVNYRILGKEYEGLISKYTKLTPYRPYDNITIYYKKDKPSIINTMNNNNYYWGYIPLLLGIFLLVFTIFILISELLNIKKK